MEKKTLNIFDFDGTLFRSPVPNPDNWDYQLIGKIKGTVDQDGLGWFQDTLTLSEPYVPSKPGDEWFSTHVKQAVLDSINDCNSTTVLLTGRTNLYKDIIENIISCAGLVFDAYGLKPHDNTGTITTMGFKLSFITDLVNVYNPQKITIWEDRPKHAEKFEKFFLKEYPHLETSVVIVNPPEETYLPFELEMQLVNELQEKREKKLEWEESVLYTGVFLDNTSREILKTKFPPLPGWTEYYHHMTICLGKIDTNTRLNLDMSVLGSEVTLTVLAFGKDYRACAVKVAGYSTTNSIPHVTLCIAPNSQPKHSNEIIEWNEISSPFTITGIIREKKRMILRKDRSRNNNKIIKIQTYKLNLGKLIADNTTKKGAEVGEAVKQLLEWMKTNNIENTVANTKIVLDHINSTML